ncbi:2-iminoacetate synthase ThiH [Shewanella sp. YIC-542]|uniref:2-iminoacetate synthase ThiH n=1 Tax=Shewanella mytili TaxID=3377111 RepID=UPI00398F7661
MKGQFSDAFASIDRDRLRLQLGSATRDDAEFWLAQPERIIGNLDALSALLSPAATTLLEPMAQASAALTRERFGANLGLYAPLYLSNLCANDCDYCGFSMSNKIRRKLLNDDEIEAEMAILKSRGFDSILLVAGEHETKAGQAFFERVFPLVKRRFNYLSLEVQPLSESGYAALVTKGLDAVLVYQETYQPTTYAQHHLRGNKQDFRYRLDTPDRAANAGVDKIGLGVLLGLDEWRLDALLMAHHLDYLQRRYWRSRYSVSLPRLRPCVGGIVPVSLVTDAALVQLVCAMRLFSPALELSLSTRESPAFRDSLLPLGITHISAASSTEPGGYANPDSALDQFEINDARSVPEVVAAIRSAGFQPVWKDWEGAWRSSQLTPRESPATEAIHSPH